KIEYVIAARPTSHRSNIKNEIESRKTHALAACRRDVFHGVRRHVWHRADYFRRRIWTRSFDPVVFARAVVLTDGVHDRRASQRPASRGRLLRVGAARAGKFLGISGSVVVAGSQHFRHGDLSNAVRVLSEAIFAVVWRGQPCHRRWIVRGSWK